MENYTRTAFTGAGYTRDVFRAGQGPAIIVCHEIPGLHPQVFSFADSLVAAGFTLFLPSLFGTPGKPLSTGYALTQMFVNVCIRREFHALSDGRSSPIVDFLRALARHAHADCGGPGVGALGMCFTGGFALAMMTEPAVIAPVLSQPSLPLGRKAGLDASASEIACAKRRLEAEDLTLLGLRYRGDPLVPDARFARLHAEFGDRFQDITLDPEHARQGTGMTPHSVLTVHLPDSGPGKDAETTTIAFFRKRLQS
ncbi:dienelactone hydrolase family protein [Sandaracinobacteroides saxicola]|nr:dienelactone hydrolase family protein [Sandaracinobacteroides saxicola]